RLGGGGGLGGLGFLDRGLGGGEAGDRHAVGRAGHVGEADLVAELHGVRVAAVLAADAELDAGAGGVALLGGDLDELADAGLVDRGERVLLEDLGLGVGAEEGAGVV